MSASRFYSISRMLFAGLFITGLISACSQQPAVDPKKNVDSQPKTDGSKALIEFAKLKVGQCTLLGDVREFNDDAISLQDLSDATLCMLGDGMGGVSNGKVGGQVAAERAFAAMGRELKKNLTKAATTDEARDAVRRALVAANAETIELSKDPDLKNCGTTIVLALFRQRHDGVLIAGVGDSRIYRVKDAAIEQLTVDHSLAQALVDNKTITPAEAKNHKFRNVLWKYLGSKEVGDNPEVKHIPLRTGERLLLCTDGLHGVVSDNQILDKMKQIRDVQQCADALCKLAIASGSRDNVSCIVIEPID